MAHFQRLVDTLGSFTLAGAIAQLIVGVLILQSRGSLRVRGSLAALFFFNGVAQLGLRAGPASPTWWAFGLALDSPTGLMLLDVGIVLGLGPRSRLAPWSLAAVVVGAVGFPLLAAGVGYETMLYGWLSDATVMAGFLGVLLGLILHARRDGVTPFSKALFLAFASRVLEFLAVIPLTYVGQPVLTSFPTDLLWRGPFWCAVLATCLYAWRRHPGLRLPILVAAAIGIFAAVAAKSGPALPVPVYAYFTLIFVRPIFVVVALIIATPHDAMSLPRRDLAPRAASGLAGAVLGLLFARSIQGPSADLALQTMVATSFALIAISVTGLVLDGRPTPPGPTSAERPDATLSFPSRITQGERLLLALRGVEIRPGEPAPYESCGSGLGQRAGILAKHVPMIVRRLNDKGRARGIGPLVEVDEGDVAGVRRKVPRYRLTRTGAAEAERIADTPIRRGLGYDEQERGEAS